MHADDWTLVCRAFDAAVDHPIDERTAVAAHVLAARPALLPEVERLLATLDDGPSAVDGTALELLEEHARLASSPDTGGDGDDLSGRRAGPYVLCERIASGGMGDVYLGEREVGTARRRVAVKVIRRGLDTDALLARFRREQQTLAALHHEGVVAFLDAGVLSDGRPFLVMEHVDGSPITIWCDAHEADVRMRVQLVRDACAAVQFAHQELVLHRDLKPHNILVTDDGRTKLLDFGVAKLLACDDDDTDASPTSAAAPLTWRYASPEQLRGERVSVATDVHALGLVLYELLAGRPAYDGGSLQLGQRTPERARPVPPSEMRDHAGASQTFADRTRARDLDAIVMHAVADDPTQRYPSAQRLADDLQRWLDGEAVHARRGSTRERALRWTRRHRVSVASAVALLLLLGSLLAGTWLGKRRAELDASRGWGAHALARRATTFLERMLIEGPPTTDAERSALDRRVTDEVGSLPESEALVRLALGHLYLEQGALEDARRQLERALALEAESGALNRVDAERARALRERTRSAPASDASGH